MDGICEHFDVLADNRTEWCELEFREIRFSDCKNCPKFRSRQERKGNMVGLKIVPAPDGSGLLNCEVEHGIALESDFLKQAYKYIGCTCIDIVSIGHDIDMVVDDEGLMKTDPQPNWLATALRTVYWTHSNGEILVPVQYPPICGVALLVAHDAEGKTIDLTDKQVEYVKSIVG